MEASSEPGKARETVRREVELTAGAVVVIEAFSKRLGMSFDEVLETFAFIGARMFDAYREAENDHSIAVVVVR